MDTIWVTDLIHDEDGIRGTMVKCSCHGMAVMGKSLSFSNSMLRKVTKVKDQEILVEGSDGSVLIKIIA